MMMVMMMMMMVMNWFTRCFMAFRPVENGLIKSFSIRQQTEAQENHDKPWKPWKTYTVSCLFD